MRIVEIENRDGTTEEHIIIDREDGSQLSMLKSVYDAQVKHLTEIVADETPTK